MWNIELPKAEWFTTQSRDLEALVREVEDQDYVAIDTETTGLNRMKDIPLYWSLAWGNRRIAMPASTLPCFRGAFADPGKRWFFANAKFDVHMLANAGISIRGDFVDTAVMDALLHEEESHALKDMSKRLLGWRWHDFEDTFPRKKGESIGESLMRAEQEDLQRLVEYASKDAFGTLRLGELLKKKLEGENTFSLYPEDFPTLAALFFKVEVPFTKVLWKCERKGIYVSQEYLKSIETPVQEELDSIHREICRVAGRMFNPASPAQMRDYFFGELKLKPRTFTKGGKKGIKQPQTDAAFLEHYAAEGVPMAKLVLREHELSKLLGTYVQGLPGHMDPQGRVHTKFNQDIARCMPAGELVLTNRGYLPVEQVVVGDRVISHTGVPRAVVETSTHTPKPIYRVTLSNGLVLRTTGNHEYRTGDGWTRADRLHIGQSVTVHADKEEWRPVEGWAPFEVSSWGRVRNSVTGTIKRLQEKGRWGHLKVTLHRQGAQKRGENKKDFAVHRLVLMAFGESKEKAETRHLNGIAWDNTVRNLSYGSSQENRADALRHGTLSQRRAGRTVLTEAAVDEIRAATRRGQPPSSTAKLNFQVAERMRRSHALGVGVADLARQHGVSYQAVSQVIKGRTYGEAPEETAVSAKDLAQKYGVSEGYIREVWSGAKWKDESYIEGAGADFYEAAVAEVVIEAAEVTYGLTVEVDHSHVTGGVVTHNTGRLSSSEPNLQNIPNPEADKFKLRGAFQATPGNDLIVLDYEQLEMRLLAAAALEPDMIQIFKDGKDIHMGNAALVFGPLYEKSHGWHMSYEDLVHAKKVDKKVKAGELPKEAIDQRVQLALEARSAAKAIGFGLNYGMKENRLARALGVTKEEAKTLIEAYLSRYPAVSQFYASAIEETVRTGYSYTILGRRRYHPEILSSNNLERWEAERKAVNNNIQGCLPASTRVLTRQGYVPIGTAPEHGETWTGSSWAPYLKVSRGPWELAELELSNGQVLRCDTRHQVLTLTNGKYQFKEYDELEEGDLVALSMAQAIEFADSINVSDIDAYWMGFALGNGCTAKGERNWLTITFGNRRGIYTKEAKAKEFAAYVTAQGFKTQRPKVYKAKVSVTVDNANFRANWESYGYPWEATAHHKRVPSVLWNASLSARKAFIRGLLHADGSLQTSNASLHMCQPELLREIQVLLRTVGVEASLHGPYRSGKFTSWRLDLVESQSTAALGYGRKGRVRISGMPLSAEAREALGALSTTTASHKTLKSRVRRGGEVSVYTAREMFAAGGAKEPQMYAVRALRSKRALGVTEETFTLALSDPLHRFDSEGVISKNTAADAVKLAMIRIDAAQLDEKFGCHMLLQVHDELVFECPKETSAEARDTVKDLMEHPFKTDLAVHLAASAGIGPSWDTAK